MMVCVFSVFSFWALSLCWQETASVADGRNLGTGNKNTETNDRKSDSVLTDEPNERKKKRHCCYSWCIVCNKRRYSCRLQKRSKKGTTYTYDCVSCKEKLFVDQTKQNHLSLSQKPQTRQERTTT